MYANVERSQIIFSHPQNPVLTALQHCWRCCRMPNSELAGTINVDKVGWCLKKVWFPRLYGLQPQPLHCFPKSWNFYLPYLQKTPASLHTSRLGPSGMCCLSPLFACLAFLSGLGVGHWQKTWEALSLMSTKPQCYTQTKELIDHGAFL